MKVRQVYPGGVVAAARPYCSACGTYGSCAQQPSATQPLPPPPSSASHARNPLLLGSTSFVLPQTANATSSSSHHFSLTLPPIAACSTVITQTSKSILFSINKKFIVSANSTRMEILFGVATER